METWLPDPCAWIARGESQCCGSVLGAVTSELGKPRLASQRFDCVKDIRITQSEPKVSVSTFKSRLWGERLGSRSILFINDYLQKGVGAYLNVATRYDWIDVQSD